MSELDADMFLLTLVMLALMAFLIVAPILYIYLRRKTAKPRMTASPSAVSEVTTLTEANSQTTEVKPAAPIRSTRPKPKQATPEQRLRAAYRVTFIVGFFTLANAILPLLAWIMPETFSTYLSGAWPIYLRSGSVGALLLVLGFLIKGRSIAAVIVAIAVFTLNWLADFFISVSNSVSTGLLFCNGLYLLFIVSLIYGGIWAIKELEQSDLNPSEQT